MECEEYQQECQKVKENFFKDFSVKGKTIVVRLFQNLASSFINSVAGPTCYIDFKR